MSPIGLWPSIFPYQDPKEEQDEEDPEPQWGESGYVYSQQEEEYFAMERRAHEYNHLSLQEQDPSSMRYHFRHDRIKQRDKDPKGSRGYGGPIIDAMNSSIMYPKRVK